MGFAPSGITPPNVSLSVPNSGLLFVNASWPGTATLLDQNTTGSFDPDQFLLTLPDGRAALISRQFGLQTLKDLNGNQLTITSAGITHSSGKSISFLRDGQGRITQITDPAQKLLKFSALFRKERRVA